MTLFSKGKNKKYPPRPLCPTRTWRALVLICQGTLCSFLQPSSPVGIKNIIFRLAIGMGDSPYYVSIQCRGIDR